MAGWAPRAGEERRKDFRHAGERAARLRHSLTASERKAWTLLRVLNKEGANFRRQASIGSYVFDFADLSRKVLVEIDGGVHDLPAAQAADAKKEAAAVARGYQVVRFKNDEVWRRPQDILRRLRAFPSPIGGGVGVGGVQNRLRRVVRRNALELDRPLPLPPPQGEGKQTGETV